jgi:uncharacterized protein
MASGLLLLLDDITSVLDDVATLTKVAVKKTSGVLGDDLALNAQQVSGVEANRELPIVWKVAKGSAINKLILIPVALILSAFAPWAITPLLIIGGAFLCFEGVEKIAHKLLHSKADDAEHHQQHQAALVATNEELLAVESTKIKGAIRTDFILSAEIIVISLSVVEQKDFMTQLLVLSGIGVLMTIGVYGLVAGIVKLDDFGLYLSKGKGVARLIGSFIIQAAPYLMKFLSIAGTAAMFLVGGGILVHKIPAVHHVYEAISKSTEKLWVPNWLAEMLFNGLVGVLAGIIILVVVTGIRKLFAK